MQQPSYQSDLETLTSRHTRLSTSDIVGSLEQHALRQVAGELDFTTFYGRYAIDPETGRQIGHVMPVIQWQHGTKVVVWPPSVKHLTHTCERVRTKGGLFCNLPFHLFQREFFSRPKLRSRRLYDVDKLWISTQRQ